MAETALSCSRCQLSPFNRRRRYVSRGRTYDDPRHIALFAGLQGRVVEKGAL